MFGASVEKKEETHYFILIICEIYFVWIENSVFLTTQSDHKNAAGVDQVCWRSPGITVYYDLTVNKLYRQAEGNHADRDNT
jgi:hypothetical protein